MIRAQSWLLSVIGAVCWLTACLSAWAEDDHAVILLYHHVSDTTPPSTSVTPAQFEQHLDYLQREAFQVLPLVEVLQRLDAGKTVPSNTVVITFDDAYISVLEEAAPLLSARGMPFSVFVASEPVQLEVPGYMTAAELRQLSDFGGTVEAHSVSHAHLLSRAEGESKGDYRSRIEKEIDDNLAHIERWIERKPRAFAYPYGEYNDELRELIDQRKLYGLAQRSGSVGLGFDPTRIPRFPMATGFDDVARLRLAINSRPLPVVEERTDAGHLILTVGNDRVVTGVQCFASSGEALEANWDDKQRHWVIDMPPTRSGRNKINCTAPAGQKDEFYWHSYFWMGH